MERITIADWPRGKLETLQELSAAMPEKPDGLLARYAGRIEGALRAFTPASATSPRRRTRRARARYSLDRHATYIVATFVAGAAR